MRRSSIAAAIVVLVAGHARAQVPVDSARPATATLAGTVTDAAGTPLANVRLTLVGESRATQTDTAGHFSLAVAAGPHAALFRRLGYRSAEHRWTARDGREQRIVVTMVPVPRALDRVIVEAPGLRRKRGTSSIGGQVVDSAGTPVEGADVRLLGSGLSSVTDAGGQFEFPGLVAGAYIVRVRRRGLRSTNHVMQVADDDSRAVTLKLHGLPPRTKAGDTASASGYGVPDLGFDAFDRRGRAGSETHILGPADLFRLEAPLDAALRIWLDDNPLRPRSRAGTADAEPGSVCLLVDGSRAVFRPLRSFAPAELQLVEVVPANAWTDPFVVTQMATLRECQGSVDRHPPYVVLWTRRM